MCQTLLDMRDDDIHGIWNLIDQLEEGERKLARLIIEGQGNPKIESARNNRLESTLSTQPMNHVDQSRLTIMDRG